MVYKNLNICHSCAMLPNHTLYQSTNTSYNGIFLFLHGQSDFYIQVKNLLLWKQDTILKSLHLTYTLKVISIN